MVQRLTPSLGTSHMPWERPKKWQKDKKKKKKVNLSLCKRLNIKKEKYSALHHKKQRCNMYSPGTQGMDFLSQA